MLLSESDSGKQRASEIEWCGHISHVIACSESEEVCFKNVHQHTGGKKQQTTLKPPKDILPS